MAERNTITNLTLLQMKARGEKIVSVTAYDASFAVQLEEAGVEVLLVGDSLGMVIQGHQSTLPVVLTDMIYHSACVARVAKSALRIVDMPFMSYASVDQALGNAARLMREGGAHMVKLEGGRRIAGIVQALSEHGIPVCAHLGLTPQSVHQLGGYRLQGRDDETAARLQEEALLLEQSGASVLVLECIPADLARRISEQLRIPTIGIGAGADCDGQVLVLYDLLGITPGRKPRFSMDYLQKATGVQDALRTFVNDVKEGRFPDAEHSFL